MTIEQENQNLLRNGYPPLADTETLHTPGPWEPDIRLAQAIVVDSKGSAVADIARHEFSDTEQSYSDECITANAHLIAAAPDLLSALQQAYNAIAWDIPGGGLSDQEEEELLDTLRAAIAKAEGRAE